MKEFNFNLWWSKTGFSTQSANRKKCYIKISKMMSNAVPLLNAIGELADLSKDKGKGHPDVIRYAAWRKDLNNGSNLAQAMKGWVPDDEILLIASGEDAGMLPETLLRAAENLDGKSEIKNALVGALAYPVVLVIAAIGLAFFFSTNVIPKFADVLPSDQWTGLAKVTLDVAEIIRKWIFAGAIVMIAFVVTVILSLKRWVGKNVPGRLIADRLIPWSIYRLMNGVSFMSSLSAVISAGTPLQSALGKIETQMSGNPYLKHRIASILKHVRNGQDIGKSMRLAKTNFPDKEIIDDLCIYGKYAGFDEALSSIAREWRKEGVELIKRRAGVLFMVAIMMMGSVVGFFSAGLFSIANQVTAAAKNNR